MLVHDCFFLLVFSFGKSISFSQPNLANPKRPRKKLEKLIRLLLLFFIFIQDEVTGVSIKKMYQQPNFVLLLHFWCDSVQMVPNNDYTFIKNFFGRSITPARFEHSHLMIYWRMEILQIVFHCVSPRNQAISRFWGFSRLLSQSQLLWFQFSMDVCHFRGLSQISQR